jgi:hypothetical protein
MSAVYRPPGTKRTWLAAGYNSELAEVHMKKILICGMLLGLLTTMSFAQRGRAAGGVGPAVGASNAAPMAHTMPNAVPVPHQGVSPNAVGPSGKTKTIAPNATATPAASSTTSPNAKSTTAPDTRNVPNRVTMPDADGLGTQPRISPNQ